MNFLEDIGPEVIHGYEVCHIAQIVVATLACTQIGLTEYCIEYLSFGKFFLSDGISTVIFLKRMFFSVCMKD